MTRAPWARPPAGSLPTMRRGVRGLKLARMPAVERDRVAAEVLAAYDSALDTLARLGAEIVTVDLPRRFADYTRLTGRIIGAESYFLVGDLVDDMTLPVDDAVRPRIASGRGVSAREYLGALREQAEAKQEFAAALGDADALLTPTTTTAAIPLDAVDQSDDPGAFHPLCQRARNLRAGGARRLHRDRAAAVRADRVPRL